MLEKRLSISCLEGDALAAALESLREGRRLHGENADVSASSVSLGSPFLVLLASVI